MGIIVDGNNHSNLNGAKVPQPALSKPVIGRMIDSLEAQHGALSHVIRTGDADKCATLKRNIDADHFQDPDARNIAEMLWRQYEASAPIDSISIAQALKADGQTRAMTALLDLIEKPEREPDFRDCIHTVLNWKRAAPIWTPEATAADETASDFPLNEIGNGQRFAAQHSADLRFCGVREQWQHHKAGRWQSDECGAAEQRAKLVGREIAAEAARENNDDKRARLLKHALTLTKRATRETMLKDAASEAGMMTTPEQFDADPHLFNLANGTLHLQTFEFRAHRAVDLLTLQSPVVYDANAQCPIWRDCMARWIPDEATRDYMQESFGVSLSGKVFEEFFNFLYGGGDNGKSTFLRLLEMICGTYWHKTQAETIMQARDKRQSNAPSPELLALKGARLVTVHEIDSKHTLNAPLIKDLTGRDAITARGLFEKRPTTFEPQFTLWMFGNGKPQIKDTSGGMWRRPRLIDFGQTIPPHERDPQLSEKLSAELPGILNWALEGLRRVYERGLIVPEAVKAATDEYRAEQDPMSGFLAECCVVKPQCTASAAKLWRAWGDWCRENGEHERTQRAFGLELKRRKFEKNTGRDGVRWFGIGLLAPQNEPETPEKSNSVNLVNLVNDIPEKLRTETSYARALSEEGSQGSQGSPNELEIDIFDDEPEPTGSIYGRD